MCRQIYSERAAGIDFLGQKILTVLPFILTKVFNGVLCSDLRPALILPIFTFFSSSKCLKS